jgi:acetyl-CoA C-acetyltransferase
MESMTQAPHLLRGSREGFKYGDVTMTDSMAYDGLWDQATDQAMGGLTEAVNATDRKFGREQQDEFAARSHQRAAAAQKNGLFDDEIVPVAIPQRKGDPVLVETDEGVRPGTTADTLGALKPAFSTDGNITAGNASQISDGGSAIVLMSRAEAERRGVQPLGEFVGYGQVAGPENVSLLHQPSEAIRAAARRAKIDVASIDLYEINEAFAAVGIASTEDLGVSEDVVNVNGGAIALGHPIGMSGNRLALTLLHELRRRGGGLGAAALCGGGGQGDALLVRTV